MQTLETSGRRAVSDLRLAAGTGRTVPPCDGHLSCGLDGVADTFRAQKLLRS